MPFFAANVSDGYMFGKKPTQDRIASCRTTEFEALEINNPYMTSPSHLAALLQNDETGEALQLVCIDSYYGPIDAPISQHFENDLSDFIFNSTNPTSAALSDHSDTASIATTTQASLAYLNSDSRVFPRDRLDGYTSIPGLLYPFYHSLNTSLTYASIINVPCLNIHPGSITGAGNTNATILNNLMKSVQILYVNNTPSEFHDNHCIASNGTSNNGQFGSLNEEQRTSLSCSQFTPLPIHSLLPPSTIEQCRCLCCPAFSMVVSLTLPIYLTPTLTTPTVSPTIHIILPLPYAQSTDSIINGANNPNPTQTPTQPPNVPSNIIQPTSMQFNPSQSTPSSTSDTPLQGNPSSSQTCPYLAKHYAHLQKTHHLNNKSYFLMRRLLPSQFVSDNQHCLFDVFHHSVYLYELTELYSHYYSELYKIIAISGKQRKNERLVNDLDGISVTHSTTPSNLSHSNIIPPLENGFTLFQQLSQFVTQQAANGPSTPTNSNQRPKSPQDVAASNLASPLPSSTPNRSNSNHISNQLDLDEPEKHNDKSTDKGDKNKDKLPPVLTNPSPFIPLTFPHHGSAMFQAKQNTYNLTQSSTTPQVSSSRAHLSSTPFNPSTLSEKQPLNFNQQQQQQHQQQHQSTSPTFDLSSPQYDFFLTSIIFTTLVFNLKFAARQTTKNDQLRDSLCLILGLQPNSYLSTIFRLLRVLVFSSSDNIGLLFNTSTFYTQHGNIISLFERLSPLIRHVRVSNLHPELDNTVFFNTVHQINYSGWVTLDFKLGSTTIPTKKLLQPWFSHYLRRRNGSAGVLFMCRGKHGKVYILLGKETKHGQKAVGPFWGRPDKTDVDIEMTAVRETIEESLGCVVGNPTVLYSALKNKGFFYKCPRINLYIVNIGVLGVKERNDIVAKYKWMRHTYMTTGEGNGESGKSGERGQDRGNNKGDSKSDRNDITSPQFNGGTNALPWMGQEIAKDKMLAKSLTEMNEVLWVDLYEMYRHYMLKSHRVLQEYGIVVEPQASEAKTSPLSPSSPPAEQLTPPGDNEDKDKKKKKDKEKDDKKKKKKDKKNDDGDDADGDEVKSPQAERETTLLLPPHNSEHTLTSVVNTITQQRESYNNLPLRRFFLREMLYMWLTDQNWLNLVHKREFHLHSIERLIELHAQQVEKKKQSEAPTAATQKVDKRSIPGVGSPKEATPKPPGTQEEDDLDHKQWRSAPL